MQNHWYGQQQLTCMMPYIKFQNLCKSCKSTMIWTTYDMLLISSYKPEKQAMIFFCRESPNLQFKALVCPTVE